MQIYHYYRIECVSEQELLRMKEYFEKCNMEVQIDCLNVLAISDEAKKELYEIENETTHLDIVLKDVAPLYKMLGRELIVSGTVDASETAGEYMDFEFVFQKNTVNISYSDWYVEADLNVYDSYDDFKDEEGAICSREVFEALKDEECYILESDTKTIVKDIPLVHRYIPSK